MIKNEDEIIFKKTLTFILHICIFLLADESEIRAPAAAEHKVRFNASDLIEVHELNYIFWNLFKFKDDAFESYLNGLTLEYKIILHKLISQKN